MKNLILLLFISTIFISCGQKTIHKEYKRFDNITWDRFNMLEFELEVEEGQLIDFDLLLRHHTLYPFDHLDVNITFYTPSGSTMSRDYHFMLKDKSGKWLADGAGDYWDINLNIRKEMKINKTGICKIVIENKMTKIKTPGVIEVGILAKESL